MSREMVMRERAATKCVVKKLPACEHTCPHLCHPSQDCPKTKCQQNSNISCPCGRITKVVVCNKNLNENNREVLNCDEQCELLLRNKKLTEAFYGKTSCSYDDTLVLLAKTNPVFVQKLELTFAELLSNSSSNTTTLPPMNKLQKRIVQGYAKHYLIDATNTTHVDGEAPKNVKLTKQRASQLPAALLSSVLKENKSPVCALLFHELNSDIKTYHLTSFLYPFLDMFELVWIDDTSALAIFKNMEVMNKAYKSLLGGLFKVKIYQQ
eukprot:TRINITY_DN4750_c0_g1_i1.p1 TRINITY_DN4750_c0_g1~~TRINITY_DN4750_c0_g1_i1.p1  ORF type:complete len:266 (-),score=73.47 TRINITY_DN4750_c0_g1_i1:112-909(-)